MTGRFAGHSAIKGSMLTLEQLFERELPAGELPEQPSRKKHP
jgi:hypothetical protein